MKFSKAKLLGLIEADTRTSKEIAAQGGFSAPSLTVWAKGEPIPGADQLAALARVFNRPLDYFFEGEGIEPVEAPSPKDIADVVKEMEGLKAKVFSLDAAVRKLVPPAKRPSSNPRISEGQSIVKRAGDKYDADLKK